ncbi:MAG: hypothetical protein OXF79_20655 [Chloroflexi bacterium]|nr:hypothetical protein [Chloroflexota bacterium]
MHTFDVVTWEGTLSDGSTCYSAWCSYVLGVGAQEDTEAEAVESITAMMTDVIQHPWDDGKSLADHAAASAEMADLMRELADEGISYQVHQVTLAIPEPADV